LYGLKGPGETSKNPQVNKKRSREKTSAARKNTRGGFRFFPNESFGGKSAFFFFVGFFWFFFLCVLVFFFFFFMFVFWVMVVFCLNFVFVFFFFFFSFCVSCFFSCFCFTPLEQDLQKKKSGPRYKLTQSRRRIFLNNGCPLEPSQNPESVRWTRNSEGTKPEDRPYPHLPHPKERPNMNNPSPLQNRSQKTTKKIGGMKKKEKKFVEAAPFEDLTKRRGFGIVKKPAEMVEESVPKNTPSQA